MAGGLYGSVVDMYLKVSADASLNFCWKAIYDVWHGILPFFVLFLVHNFILASRLLLKRKTVVYIVSILCVLVVFQLWYEYEEWREQYARFRISCQSEVRQAPSDAVPGKSTPAFPPAEGPESGRIFPFRLQPGVIRLIIATLMLGLNIGVKLLFKSQRDEEVLRELERQNLQQELEYLKYQINPHFFMNTLNNIHALVDIDAKKAKSTLLELSRLMRYVLYEASSHTVLLVREVEFLHHYIALMRLRFTEKVDIPYEISEEVQVPPLLFISFVENAFKHGVSYQLASFICMEMHLEGNELFFRCINSNHAGKQDRHSGIGMENVRKRLKLIYGNNYYLNINKSPEAYDVLLVIPILA